MRTGSSCRTRFAITRSGGWRWPRSTSASSCASTANGRRTRFAEPGDSGGPGDSGEWAASAQASGPRRKVIHAWAVQASRRRQAAAELKARRAASRSAGVSPYGRTGSYRLDHVAGRGEADRFARAINESGSAPPSVVHMREVEQTVKTLNERAALAHERAEAARERNTAPGESPVEPAAAIAPAASWDAGSVAALALPALLLVIVLLV